MRLYEFETTKQVYRQRKTIPLRTLNKLKIAKANELAKEELRKPLLAAMYGHTIDDEAAHVAQMRALELEREQLELAKEKAVLANIQAEQGQETFKAIQRLSRSAMQKRKKAI